MAERPLFESAWRRGWHDTVSGWKNWIFLLVQVVGAPLAGIITGNAWISLVVVVVGLGGVWMTATATASHRQRNEARALVVDLQPRHDASGALRSQLQEFIAEGEDLKKRILEDAILPIGLTENWRRRVKKFLEAYISEQYARLWDRAVTTTKGVEFPGTPTSDSQLRVWYAVASGVRGLEKYIETV